MASDPLRLPAAAAVALASLIPARLARADEPPPPAPKKDEVAKAATAAAEGPPKQTYKATRRGGFMVGVDLGFGVGSIVGYPNDVKKIGFASAYTVTGARPASLGEAWIGAALTDWINFGLGF